MKTIIHISPVVSETPPDPRPTPPLFDPVDVTGWDPTEVADLAYMDDDAQDHYAEDAAAWEGRQRRQAGRQPSRYSMSDLDALADEHGIDLGAPDAAARAAELGLFELADVLDRSCEECTPQMPCSAHPWPGLARQTGREVAADVAAGDLAGLVEEQWPGAEQPVSEAEPAGPRASVRTSPTLPWGDGQAAGVIATGGITVAVVSLPYARDGASWAETADQVLRAAGWARTGSWAVEGATVTADVERVRP